MKKTIDCNCKCKCKCDKIMETMRISNILYYNVDTNDTSYFNPGDSPSEKTLSIKICSEISLCKNTKLKLKLIGYRDEEYNFISICPIKIHKKLPNSSKCVRVDIVDAAIPLPCNVLYIPTIITECVPQMEKGIALEYCFIVEMSCHKCNMEHKFPLTGIFSYYNSLVDIKCEKLEFVNTQDDQHPIKIICEEDCNNTTILYSNLPHCVSHCQARKPIVFYYTV